MPKRLHNGPGGGSKSEVSSVDLSVKLSEVEVSFVVRRGVLHSEELFCSKASGGGRGDKIAVRSPGATNILIIVLPLE